MKWEKLGLVVPPQKDKWWSQKYAMLPVPKYIPGDEIVRVYYGTTDKDVYGRIAYTDLDAKDLRKVLDHSEHFIIDVGELGTFDDCGVVPSCHIEVEEKQLLFTVGFQRCVKVPYMLFAGLLEADKGQENYKRYSEAPILTRTRHRYIGQGAPSVIYDNGKYRMWHWFATKWISVNNKLYLDYQIGYAESSDCYNWEMHDITCIMPDPARGEFACARPWVIKEDGIYKMWFSKRLKDKLYRIGYAESPDGIKWVRKDEQAGIEVSEGGWDSEMICYPSILDLKGERYLFYNGNNNGETGFGIAKQIDK